MPPTKPRRSRSRHAEHAPSSGADLSRAGDPGGRRRDRRVRVASLVDGKIEEAEGCAALKKAHARPGATTWIDLTGASPEQVADDRQGDGPPPAHRRGHPRGQPAGEDRGDRRAHPHRHLRVRLERPRRPDRDRHRPRQGLPADRPRTRVGPANGARPARRARSRDRARSRSPPVGARRRDRRRLLPAPRPAGRRDRGRPGARHRERPSRDARASSSRSRPSCSSSAARRLRSARSSTS